MKLQNVHIDPLTIATPDLGFEIGLYLDVSVYA